MLSQSTVNWLDTRPLTFHDFKDTMLDYFPPRRGVRSPVMRSGLSKTCRTGLAVAVALSAAIGGAPSYFVSSVLAGETKTGDDKKPAAEVAKEKEAAKKVDEIAEAGKLVAGPAGQPECVWVGRRIVGLLWRDDLETASRHRELYEKFGCPFPYVQDAFRCVVRNGELDPKAPEALSLRVHACWVNPKLEPSTPSVAADAVPGPAVPAP